jgi:riboflavin biosynthesis pyrimidine reductase
MKPHVICHMVTSVDGKVLGDRWGKLPGGGTTASLFESTAESFGIPAWLVGTTTMKEFMGEEQRLPTGGPRVPREDFLADPKARRFAIGTDARGVLRFQKGDVDGDHVVLLVSERVSQGYLRHLREAGVSYLFCGEDRVDLPRALDKVGEALRLKKLMLQGGGTFNGAMLKAGLVDELSQIIVPIADGGGPTVTGVFDAPGEPLPKAAARLKLESHEVLPGGAVWLRYRLTPAAR